MQEGSADILSPNRRTTSCAQTAACLLLQNFNIRKLAACTKNKEKTFYILCGWMEADDAEKLKKELDGDDSNAFCIFENDHSNIMSKPPTKLKNPSAVPAV
jgi:V/A-type H+-transporting ATPase subunit I